MTIALEIHICDQRRSYVATWEGPAAEARAIDWITARSSTHAVFEIEATPIPQGALYDYLYPLCEHGMRGDCYGPQHYYMDDEERYYAGM